MEEDEWSYMPARRTDARRQISGHEISSGKHGGTGREVEIKLRVGSWDGCVVMKSKE